MKKFLAFLCLFSLLTASTCENESFEGDAETLSSTTDLIGTWNLLEFDVLVDTTVDFSDEQIASNIEVFSTEAAYTLSFTATNFSSTGSYTYTANVNANGEEAPMATYSLDNLSGSGTYVLNGSALTSEGAFYEFSIDGEDLSEFQGEQTVDFDISEDGQTLVFIKNETLTETDEANNTTSTSTIVSSSSWSRE